MKIEFSKSVLFTLFLGFITMALPSSVSDLEDDIEKYIKKIEKIYPLSKWEKQLDSFKEDLEDSKKTFYSNPNKGIDKISYKNLKKWSAEVSDFKKYRAPIKQVIEQLKAEKIIKETFPKTMRVKNVNEARARSRLVVTVRTEEKKRLREKETLLLKIDIIIKQFEEFQADWMLYFARQSLFKSVKLKFEKFHYSENGVAYQAYTQLFKAHLNHMKKDPSLAEKDLMALKSKLSTPMKDLKKLESSLTPDMIYASILENAAENKIDFTMKAEEKIESILQLLSDQNLKAVKLRQKRWEAFHSDIETGIELAKEVKVKQARRLARKKEMENQVSALTSGTGNEIEINADIKGAINNRTKPLKNSKISSGRKKLDVEVDAFSDTLAHVSDLSFTVENTSTKFEQVYSDVRENNGLYVYTASDGRADKNDLHQFINEVGLLSFGNSREFLSYQLPQNWNPSSTIHWETEKQEVDTNSYKREFSYVELFTEAHRKGNKKYQVEKEQINYTPANTILIFNAQGKILRYQIFSSIRALRILKSDLVHGTLYYKFLNYSTRGSEIYLNGIDHEIKTGKPS